VDNSAGVRVTQASRDLRHDLDLLQQGQRRLGFPDRMLQIPAFEQFHDDVRNALMLSELIDSDDVRVTEAPGSGGLVPEPRKHPGFAVGDQSLDGNLAPYGGIETAKYTSETAVPKLGQDLEFADTLCHGTSMTTTNRNDKRTRNAKLLVLTIWQ
jgi:hypothetical protein